MLADDGGDELFAAKERCLPLGTWTVSPAGLSALVQDNLGRLGRRGLIRDDFLRRALELHQHGHAAYDSELICVLTVREIWLTSPRFE